MMNITKISNNRGNAETVIKNTHKKMANLPKILNIYPIDKTIKIHVIVTPIKDFVKP